MQSLLSGWMVVVLSLLPLGTLEASTSSPSLPDSVHSTEKEEERKIKPNVDVEPEKKQPNNTYPIILVHGLGGFDTLYGFHYWGGSRSIAESLRKKGYEVYTTDIGTFSSNWDRACELYAQIKGGRVDYGKAHSEKHGHARYGRTYPGLYPEWGTVDPHTNNVRKVHLISHSMGGQTARMLVHLLVHGDSKERKHTPKKKVSSLFAEKKRSWVHSMVTLSTPHDGTPFLYEVSEKFPYIQQVIGAMAAVFGNRPIIDYDFKLDQWGLKRKSGESFDSYLNRVINSRFWEKTKDTAEWDLSPEGAREINRLTSAQPDIYYFSVGNEQTYRDPFTGYQRPELWMNPLFYYPAIVIGRSNRINGDIVINQSWWENDGLVSTNSMDGPEIGSTDEIVSFDGKPKIGKWNYLGTLDSYDHLDIVGIGIRDMRDWFGDLAQLLQSLPR
ncbi:esterase/lipase family protein [Melghirimyces algeriensis]|uniref:triacylglycerol lipase n=1 Tax=Melghirimyces algeriensis TaxID=910412 RepID=A0A521E4A3_9BACL|nr:lipase [Melghirimyces algeriensis]SMO78201.1 triacylglycerol lipase [Melghirimyces algeriensis]